MKTMVYPIHNVNFDHEINIQLTYNEFKRLSTVLETSQEKLAQKICREINQQLKDRCHFKTDTKGNILK